MARVSYRRIDLGRSVERGNSLGLRSACPHPLDSKEKSIDGVYESEGTLQL